MADHRSRLAAIVRDHEAHILADWTVLLAKASRGAIDKAELEEQARTFVGLLTEAARRRDDIRGVRVGRSGRCWRALSPRARARASRRGDGDVRLLAQAAAVRACSARRTTQDAEGLARETVGRHDAARQARALHHRGLPEEPRGGDRPPAAGAARAVDAGRRALGRHPRAAADRHARQRAHAGRDGEPAAADRRDRRARSRSSTSPACRPSTRWSRSTC